MKHPDEKISLRQALVERFADEQLDAAQLRSLRAAAGGLPARPDRRRWLGAAAVVVASAGLGFLASGRTLRGDGLALLADEVARNHLAYTAADLDVAGESIALLRPAFAALGFSLLDPPDDPALHGAILLGGRHCSLAGVPAVQLHYRTAAGEVTVCQARFDAKRHRGAPDMRVAAAPAQLHARGLRVSLCHMQGVLLALATVG